MKEHVFDWRVGFHTSESSERIPKRWEETKNDLANDWKRRHRKETVKNRDERVQVSNTVTDPARQAVVEETANDLELHLAMISNTLKLFFLLLICQLVNAQFNIFEQLFGGGQNQPQQQQRHGAEHWRNQADATSCSSYLCPDTLVCVSNPAECPCPHVEDIKCLIPDATDESASTVVCARGDSCNDIVRLTSKKW